MGNVPLRRSLQGTDIGMHLQKYKIPVRK
jgi:hypothetical protein